MIPIMRPFSWFEKIKVKGSGQECPLYTGLGENSA
jgi:glutathione peroxidase-family protein